MKAYKLRATFPSICEVKEIEVAKFIRKTILVDGEILCNGIKLPYSMSEEVVCTNGYRIPTVTGDEDVDYTEYFRTKEEAYTRAVELAERFLCVSKGDLAAAEQNLQTLLNEQLPSLLNYTAN